MLLLDNKIIAIVIIAFSYFPCFVFTQGIIFPGDAGKISGDRNSSAEEGATDYSRPITAKPVNCDKLCIPLDLCPSLFELLEAPNQWKIKLLQARSCGFTSSGDPLVWCDDAICNDRSRKPKPNKEVTSTRSHAPVLPTTFKNYNPKAEEQEQPKRFEATNFTYVADELCGTSLPSRIHGGYNAAREEFPWIAAIAIQTPHGPQIICGGALISDQWVITAAHCVVDSFHRPRNISHIRVGAHDISKSDEDGAESIGVKSIFYHPQFRERPVIKNDIALLKLEKNVAFSVTIGTICLPGGIHANPTLDEPSRNRKAFIAGWGGNGMQTSFNILQKVEIPLIPRDTCVSSLMRVRVRVIPELQICAGAKNRDGCKGDSGGPLMVTVNGRTTLIGIISYGTVRCDGRLPGVYTRVRSYMNWVTEIMFNNTSS